MTVSAPHPIRIAHVISTPSGVGGAEQTLAQLVAGGEAHGWEQTVLNPFAADPDDPAVAAFYAPARYGGRVGQRLWQLPGLRRWLDRELDRIAPDIVHAHLLHASILVASLGRREPTVLSHQHGDHLRVSGARAWERLDRWADRRYDRVVGCSAYVETWVTEQYRLDPARVCHVHNGWSGSPLERPGPVSAPGIVCVARLRAQKNHALLLDAVARVRRSVPGVTLTLVGDGPERAALERLGAELGLGDALRFAGTAAQVWPFLAEARVFALASDYEPLGVAALEAMAAGRPVVATAVGGLVEIVTPDCGILTPAGDAGALAAALERVLRDDRLAAGMGSAGLRRAQTFTAERMVDGYRAVYAELLGRPLVPEAVLAGA